MPKKSFCPRFINILTLFVLCLLLNAPVQSQQPKKPEEVLSDLFEQFKTEKKLPCGQRDEAIRIGQEIVEKFSNDELNKPVIDFVKIQITKIEAEDKACKEENSLANLYEKYKTAKKSKCGERINAIRIGKRIIESYADDTENQAVIEFIKKDVPRIEKEDRICERNALYDNSYKIKNWSGFFAVSKQIIDEDGDSGFALDVMLTLVSVGLNITAYDKVNTYNSDTVRYAKKAIELIEAGVRTKARWGIFEPFESREKALGWLNYTIGYISYFRLNENKKAIPYFYRSAQYEMEFKNDAFVYQAVAIHYFDKEAVMASSLAVNEFINKANTAATNPLDDGFGLTAKETAEKNEIAALYKNLLNLYNMRYNLEEDENVTDLADYIQKIINRPLIDPSAKIYRRK